MLRRGVAGGSWLISQINTTCLTADPHNNAHRFEPHFLYRCQSTYSMVVAGRDPNTEAFRGLRDAGVDVKWAPSRVIGRAHKMPTIHP